MPDTRRPTAGPLLNCRALRKSVLANLAELLDGSEALPSLPPAATAQTRIPLGPCALERSQTPSPPACTPDGDCPSCPLLLCPPLHPDGFTERIHQMSKGYASKEASVIGKGAW